ncbi:unnamed protein product [Effrenium voratum]|uniref:Uncharacterized protein n=1 Tax=Effrenium voratum TaxID=2562239 RepID=A0AA36N9M3_9DINO|nr:unnamed protein product [Effrenium voratum]
MAVIQMQLHSTHHTGNMRSTLLSIYREGGILSFWRGNGAMLCHRGVVNCINFPVNDLCKQQLQQQDRELRNACSALAAALTGTAAGHPLDVIKTRLSASKRFGYVGIWQTAQRMYSEEGLRSFVAGFRVSLAAVGPSVAACFYLKDRFSASHVVHQLSTRSRGWLSESSIAGGAAGCVTSFAFFPLDSWKRQLQMSVVTAGGRARLAAVPLQGAALLDAYRGLLPELIKVGCNTAIMFGISARGGSPTISATASCPTPMAIARVVNALHEQFDGLKDAALTIKSIPNGLAKFERLQLDHPQVSGDIGDLKRLKLLKEMHLRGTNVTGDIQVVRKLPHLVRADLSRTRVTGRLRKSWQGCCQHLRELVLADSQVSWLPQGEDARQLRKYDKRQNLLPALALLDVSRCPLNGLLRDFLEPLAILAHVGRIGAAGCNLSGELPDMGHIEKAEFSFFRFVFGWTSEPRACA